MTNEEFQLHVVESLSELKTDMHNLVGNGQPGRVRIIEQNIQSLTNWRWLITGGILVLSTVLSTAVHFLFSK